MAANESIDWIAVARRVVARHQYEEVDGVMLDAVTASMLCGVADHLNDKNRATFEAMGLGRAITVGWKLVV